LPDGEGFFIEKRIKNMEFRNKKEIQRCLARLILNSMFLVLYFLPHLLKKYA